MKTLTKKIFLCLGIISGILACDTEPNQPKNTIDEQTMADILAEIHLTEAKVSRLSFRDYDSTKVAYKELERQILAKYKTDTARYRASYNYYITKPEVMIEIYDQTLRNLEVLKNKRKMADSLAERKKFIKR